MDPDQRTEQKRIVVDTPGVRREVMTERVETVPAESGISTGMIAIIAVFAIAVIGIVIYLVTNMNANESANRNANIVAASQAPTVQPQAPPPTIIQQPAAPQQAPIIIQQPAQPAPVVVQQPVPAAAASDSSAVQDAATKRLTNDADMGSISVSVSDARAVLTGNAASEAIKARAERMVRDVAGVKSVENKIFVAGN